jgi:WD40 repeat protein/calcineurin-like phosphoesterase family protein
VRLVAAAALASALLPAATARAADNGSVAFAGERAGKPVIYLSEPDGSGLRVVPTRGWAGEPAVSPGGRRIAFARRGRLGSQIWTSYVDGTVLVQVTSGPSDREPRWSPEGDALAFARGARGSRDVYRVDADGSAVRRLTYAAADDSSPAWSVDDRIAFVRRVEGADKVFLVRSRPGGQARRLTRGDERDSSPAWSPSGRTVAVARGRPGRRDLYLLRARDGRERRLTALPGDEGEPAWSPDGRWIAFAHRRAGRRQVLLLKVGRRPPRRLGSQRLRRLASARAQARAPHWQRAGEDPVIAAGADIACDPLSPYFLGGAGSGGNCRQLATSNLLLRMDLAAVLVPGDIQYEDGKLWKFQQSFDPSWGRLKPLIRPVPGNHEYEDPGAAGYFDYFGAAAGPRGQGWYSFDVGSWHLIALNSECGQIGGCGPGSPQERWLRADLAAHPAACTLAFWHHPRFTSGRHDAGGTMLHTWRLLHAAGVDVVLNGHEHFYERFAPQTPDGVPDPARGIRQFTVGNGGKSRFGFLGAAPNSELRDNRNPGVLKLTLREGGYAWEMRAIPDGRAKDGGEGLCG